MIRTAVAGAVLATTLGVTAAVTAVTASPAGAAGVAVAAGSTTSTAAGLSELQLAYSSDAGYAAAVLLDCHPPAGAHPQPVKACNTLKKTGGKPEKLKAVAGRMCTLEYAPVTAEITGHWKGRTLRWSRTFGNRCELDRVTGVLFAF